MSCKGGSCFLLLASHERDLEIIAGMVGNPFQRHDGVLIFSSSSHKNPIQLFYMDYLTIMSKPSPPPSPHRQHYATSEDDASLGESLQQILQHEMPASKHKEELGYYELPLCQPFGRDNVQTSTTFPPSSPTLANLGTKMPPDIRVSDAQLDYTYASFLQCASFLNNTNSENPSCDDIQQKPSSPSSRSINRSASSSSHETNNDIVSNVSAYFLYQNATRDHFKQLYPHMTQGELSKYTSLQYKSLPPQEKAAWTAQANAASLNEEQSNRSSPLMTQQKTPIKKRKDPSAPKRAVGAYVWFTMDERPKIQKEFKDITFAEMGKKLGERWRGLDPEEKKKYDIMASKDRGRLQTELKAYKESQSRQMKARKAQADGDTQQQQKQQQLEYAPQPVADVNGYKPEYGYSEEFCSDLIKRLSDD